MAATADRLGIRFAGHIPLDVGLRRALGARYATIDHQGAREIIEWLDGGYRITDEIVQTQ